MISGKYLAGYLGGTDYIDGLYAWRAEEGGDVLDGTTGADEGFENEEMGVENLHISVKLYLDIVDGVYSSVQRGTVITDLVLKRDETDTVAAYTVPLALVTRSSQGAEVRGKWEVDCEIHSKGSYTSNDPEGE